MKVYISGPITGMPNDNRDAFKAAEKELAANGFEPVNPHTVWDALPFDCHSWQDYMRADIKALMDCDAVFMLEGWENSRVARLESFLACELGIAVCTTLAVLEFVLAQKCGAPA